MDQGPGARVILVYQECAGIGLRQALGQAGRLLGLAGAVALIYSPDCCQLARLDGDCELRGARGEASRLDFVFEARLFSPKHELRWALDEAGGRAVLLSEGGPVDLPGWTAVASVPVERLAELTYLLIGWSEGPAAPGWIRLTAGRTHAIEVPLETSARRVALRVVEYAARDPEHGNVHVCEERLLGLEPATIVREESSAP